MPQTTGPDSGDRAARICIAVIGAGTMGSAMVSRLLSSQLDVAAWSRHPETTRPLRDLGATTPADVADALSGAEIVLTLLPTEDAIAGVMLGGGGLDVMRPDAGMGVAPVAAAIADRWRQLVREGWGGLDVAAARRGLGYGSSGESGR